MTSFWSYANRYPPILCRLLARVSSSRPLTAEEIAVRSNLSLNEVNLISQQTDWNQITFASMRAFLIGCGIDFCRAADMQRLRVYLGSKPTWKYLRTSKLWTKTYEPMLKRYASSLLLKQR